MQNPATARILDANANRAREALRVLEDYARFALDDQPLSADLKSIRHTLATALAQLGLDEAILHRDTPNDVGTANKTATEFQRETLADVVIAAGKRLSESLRVLEEIGKTIDPKAAATLEQLRYRGYSLEQTLTRIARQSAGGPEGGNRFASVRLYVLLTESLCKRPWETTLDAVLGCVAGRTADQGPVLAVQLREKSLPDGELLRRARVLTARCRAAGALAIINDRPDIALLAGADGIHVGQTDLPCLESRKLLGHGMIVGVSTERLEQARQAVRDGATYIAVGPMFPTTTKEKPRLAGPQYAAEAKAAIPLPLVAIGGITLANLPQLAAVGVRTVAVCAAIISSDDPAARAHELLAALEPSVGRGA